jgi:DNA-binding NtrC family response regulator
MVASGPKAAVQSALVVDDDLDMCWVLEAALKGVGCAAITVSTGRDALKLITTESFPIAFVDARLPDIDGLRLSEQLRRVQPELRIFIVSGYFLTDDAEILEAIRTQKINGFLAKPFQIGSILAALME